jgi:hypothetical protein
MQVKAPKVTQVPVQRIDFLGHSNASLELGNEEKNLAEKLAIRIRARL